jgi:hypothetical protein
MNKFGRNLIIENLTATIDRMGITIARPAAGTTIGPAWSHSIA